MLRRRALAILSGFRDSAEPWLHADAITSLASGDFCPLLIPDSVPERIFFKVKRHENLPSKHNLMRWPIFPNI